MMQKIFSILLSVILLICAAWRNETWGSDLSSHAPNYRLIREEKNSVRGLLEKIGAGFVAVEGATYRTAPKVTVKNAEGEIMPGGMKELGLQWMIELVLERNLVVQIKVISLPK
jgi:hypothetical protein